MDINSLKQWFLNNRRDLPWREETSAYRVWVSEIMLQQTQVSVVVPYFLRWMERFPTVERLAAAPIEEVIKEWEGLGYYSRARNLHEGAKQIVKNFNGQLPSEENKLKTIKGIGSYTVGAIRSFAFHEKAPAVDGNVMRVISRLFEIEGDITKKGTQQEIYEQVLKILPDFEPWIISEALIELGATICTKKPICNQCPLKKHCIAFKKGSWNRLPYKSTKTTITNLHRLVSVIIRGQYLLLRKGEKGKVMHDLHEFPYFEIQNENFEKETLQNLVRHSFSMEIEKIGYLNKEIHSFTRFKAHLYPEIFHTVQSCNIPEYHWYHFNEVDKLAFSSGHRRIYQAFKKIYRTSIR